MKLAEALSLRKDLNTRISQLSDRLTTSITRTVDEEAPENAAELIEEITGLYDQLAELTARINTTNLEPIDLPDRPSVCLMVLAIERETARKKSAFFRNLAATARRERQASRYRDKDEVKTVVTVDAKGLDVNADRLARLARTTDLLIQQLDWQIDLVG